MQEAMEDENQAALLLEETQVILTVVGAIGAAQACMRTY